MPERSQIEGCKFSCDPSNIEQACQQCSQKIIKGCQAVYISNWIFLKNKY
jgi:Mg-chelatase subunit ChlI